MSKKFTRNNLKRMLSNTVDKLQLLESETTPLNKKQDKTLLANQKIISMLKEALEKYDTDFNKSCELICEIPYNIVNPGSDMDKYPIIGSSATYSRTDTLRHYVRMLPETDFSNKNVWNNVLVIGA